MREPSNLPPGVTDRMIEEAQRDPYEGTRFEERAHALWDTGAKLERVVTAAMRHSIPARQPWMLCLDCRAGRPCPWPERLRRNPNLEERSRAALQKIAAELDGIDRLLAADEEERR